MKNVALNYNLDFVIPQGPTGPEGPTGIEGKMGPTGPASLNALIFSEFYGTNQSGDLAISKSTILPNNSSVFVSKMNEIEITEPGNYEFTASGVLGGLTQNEVLSISMTITDENNRAYSVMLASIVADAKQEYFSQTMLMTFSEKQTIDLFFRKDNSYQSAVENVNLLIKKLSF